MQENKANNIEKARNNFCLTKIHIYLCSILCETLNSLQDFLISYKGAQNKNT